MSSPFTVRPCTIADAQALATVAMCERNGRSLEDAISAAARRNAKLLLTGRHVERHVKVLSGDGEIAGYARWILPDVHGVDHMWTEARVPDVSADAEAKAERMFEEARGDWPPFGKARPQQGANQEDPIIEAGDRLLRGKDYIVLDSVSVLPSSFGKGIGTLLLRSGFRAAESLGLDIFIHAKVDAVAFYQRLGCPLLAEVRVPANIAERGVQEEYAAFFIRKVRDQCASDV